MLREKTVTSETTKTFHISTEDKQREEKVLKDICFNQRVVYELAVTCPASTKKGRKKKMGPHKNLPTQGKGALKIVKIQSVSVTAEYDCALGKV